MSLENYSYLIEGINQNTKQYQNSGTGFILSFGKFDFLVTNYHVLTGKDPTTREKISFLRDTNTAVIISIPVHGNTNSKKIIPIYDSIGNRLFPVYHLDSGNFMDITVIRVPSLKNEKNLFLNKLSLDYIDSNENSLDKQKLLIIGFPYGKRRSDKIPHLKMVNSVKMVEYDNIFNPYISFDDTTTEGMSGAPIYIFKNNSNELRLIGINCEDVEDARYPNVKGVGIYIKYALQMIQAILTQKQQGVDLYMDK